MKIDEMMRNSFPVLCAPIEEELPIATKDGVRYVLASDGLWQGIESDWLSFMHRLSTASLPFGKVHDIREWKCSFPNISLWKQFLGEARQAMPNETAGLIVWNSVLDSWRLVMRVLSNASSGSVCYANPELGQDEVPVIDIHSHGAFGAFFSEMDNTDDRGSFKIAATFGRVNEEVPQLVIRLVAMEKFYGLKLDQVGRFEFTGEIN